MTHELYDPALVSSLARHIRAAVPRPLRLMEVCGTHTMAISRYSLRQMLAGQVELVSGPGCPVCVTDAADIDRMIALAETPGVMVTTFGDMLRVPGSHTSLAAAKAAGADVRVVYSPFDALALAAAHPDRTVVFLGIGFETTVPVVAAALDLAVRQSVGNFAVCSAHKTLPDALRLLLADAPDIDGLLLPGHVLAVSGRAEYDFLAAAGVPAVVAGFAPAEILRAVLRLAEMVRDGQPAVENAYTRVVREEGNPAAKELTARYFVPADAAWRGLGVIPGSGLEIAPAWAEWDAKRRFPLDVPPAASNPACRCGLVLRGKLKPPDCPQYERVCTPELPLGPCMVSSEGACAAYYQYERHKAGETDGR